jgi:hypothetical protein
LHQQRVTGLQQAVIQKDGEDRKSPSRRLPAGALCFWSLWGLTFDDFAGLDAGRADVNPFAGSVDLGLHGLQVDVPPTAGRVVGVGDVVSELRAFAAEIAFGCHDCYSNLESQKLPGDQA